MIKLIAAYRPVNTEGRQLEITSGEKLRQELVSDYKTDSIYQDVNGNLYTYFQLKGLELNFTDKVRYRLAP